MNDRTVIPLGLKKAHVPTAGECPGCLRQLTAASSETGEMPRPKDISICAYCGTICCFEEGLILRAANEDDLVGLQPDQRDALIEAQQKIRAYTKITTAPDRPLIFAATIPKFNNPPR